MGLEYDLGLLPTLSEPIGSHIRIRYNGRTLRCLWFCGTKTFHKVLAHPSHPLAIRVDTFKGVFTLHRLGSLLLDRF